MRTTVIKEKNGRVTLSYDSLLGAGRVTRVFTCFPWGGTVVELQPGGPSRSVGAMLHPNKEAPLHCTHSAALPTLVRREFARHRRAWRGSVQPAAKRGAVAVAALARELEAA